MHQRCTAVVIAIIANLFGGCLDASPVNLAAADAGLVIEASTGDGPVPIDAYAHPECRACIAAEPEPGPGCGDKLAACATQSAHCIDIYECAYSRGCVTKPTQNESIFCALPCADALKITDVNDQSIQLAIRLTECFHSACASVCEVSELGAALRSYRAR
jgi:hypothetical protein